MRWVSDVIHRDTQVIHAFLRILSNFGTDGLGGGGRREERLARGVDFGMAFKVGKSKQAKHVYWLSM